MKLLLNGRGGKVGRVLAPALEAAGHELVDSLEQAEVMVDFTSPQIGLANAEAALAAGVPSVPPALRRSTRRTSPSGPC